jgi:ubiquitin C-terminal hydrolase
MSTIWTLPKVLIICLKRFADPNGTSKNHTVYDIMENISFHNKNLGKVSYRLKIIVNHIGANINSGHYTSVVIENERYWNIDDDHVTQINPFNKSSIAYMLIYERT